MYATDPAERAYLRASDARRPLPPARGLSHLPARYVPGSPLRWRYRTAADGEQPRTPRER